MIVVKYISKMKINKNLKYLFYFTNNMIFINYNILYYI